jgi:GcrA cell cycle regulator
MTWTSHHETILLDGHAAKKTPRVIAADLTDAGYPSTRNTVLGRLFRKGLCKPTPSARGPRSKEPTMVTDMTMFDGCRWPIGEVGKPGFHFCCVPAVIPGKPYCAEHCAKAYRPKEEQPTGAPKPQRPGTVVLLPTTAPMRGAA